MAANWQETTSQQVKVIADRLNELLSRGLDLVQSELGVDLGLRPELYPPWVTLLAACIGLVLMVALWASACRGVFKKRPTITDDSEPAVTKPSRNEEPKKKKRKIAERKVQSNGRAADEPQEEEVQVIEEDVPHHPPAAGAKTEKAFEVKKAKKKPKQAGKEVKAATAGGKEPGEGTWETKVSNKEKREQRRKDKTPGDGSGSPGGGDPPPKHTPPEQPKATASLSAGQKKKKAESSKARAEKGDVVTPQVDSSEVVEVSAGWTDLDVKAPANAIGPGPDHRAPNQRPALATAAPTKRCSLETEGSWTVIDATEISLAERSVGGDAVEPLPGTAVVDEWSGLNGVSADPSSDWNVPSEAWVNEEQSPTPEETPPPQEELPPEPAKVSDGEKDKADSPPDGNGKAKKKKKKKKKQAEDGGVAVQEGEEPERAGEAETALRKQPVQQAAPSVQAASAAAPPAAREEVQTPPAVTQVPQTPAEAEPTANQKTLPAPSQTEEKPSKMVKKKKARRET